MSTIKPAAQRVPNQRGRHNYWDFGETYNADLTPEPLYTLTDAQIATLEQGPDAAYLSLFAQHQATLEQAQRDALLRFAGKVLADARENIGSDVNGGDIQDWAVACGLLESVNVQEPCCDECLCLEYHGSDGFPVDCLRSSELGKAAIAAAEGE